MGATSWRKLDADRSRSDDEDIKEENEQVVRDAEAEAEEHTALEADESDDG